MALNIGEQSDSPSLALSAWPSFCTSKDRKEMQKLDGHLEYKGKIINNHHTPGGGKNYKRQITISYKYFMYTHSSIN